MRKFDIVKLTAISGLLLVSMQACAHKQEGSSRTSAPLAPINVKAKTVALTQVAPEINPHVLGLALHAYNKARAEGRDSKQVLTVIDYSLPSTDKRLWTFDLKNNQLLFHTLVAQGRNSGVQDATHFSNAPKSLESSVGLFETGTTYYGKDGYSLRLNGLSTGYNDNAYERAIVMHGAWYVNESFAKQNDRIGRSWGCPAVPKVVAKPLINSIKDGTLIFAYGNDQSWLKHGPYVT